MYKLRLAFYKGRKSENPQTTFFDRLVCFTTNSRYSHVELVYQYDAGSRMAHCWGASPRDKGVRKTLIYMNPDHWDIIEYDVWYTKSSLEEWVYKENGSAYDWLGAIGTRVLFIRQSNSKWFCSELLAAYIGMNKPHRVTPKRLYMELKYKLRSYKRNIAPT